MRYYVYILLDDMVKGHYDNEYCSVNFKPFYVGKGDSLSKNKNKRHLAHYKEVSKNYKKITNPHKFNKIKKLQESGFEPNFIIVYQDNDEKKVLEVESRLIKFYGKVKDGGILTNISDGGVGGNLFDKVDGLREKINKISSIRWSGENNPNFKRNKEETYSFKFKKENGYHWNSGRKMSNKHKLMLKKCRYERLLVVEMICPKTYEVVDKIKTLDAIKKYNLSPSGLTRAIKHGGKHKGFYWKYENKELVLSKSKRIGYVKPRIKYKSKKIYFKKNINDINEIIFDNIHEASINTGFHKEVIRRKCKNNNTTENIFRYENDEFKFDIKKGKKIKIMVIDEYGNEVIYESATDAAKYIDGNVSSIIQVCKGKRKKHRNLKFKYIEL
jgi:hypothetical protein